VRASRRNAALVSISFTRRFVSQSFWYSLASQSSNSGCDGGSPCTPKSALVRTRPVPKNCCHNRFTATRAVSGFSFATIQFAKSRRVARAVGSASLSGGSTAGTPGSTFSPFLSYCPRIITNASRGTGKSLNTIVPGIASAAAACAPRAASHFARSASNSGDSGWRTFASKWSRKRDASAGL
jgi:hypothetical protein